MTTIDLAADLNAEDDEGRNWALLPDDTDRTAIVPGVVLRAGTAHFWSWVRIDEVDDDGHVHFHQISAAEATRAGARVSAP